MQLTASCVAVDARAVSISTADLSAPSSIEASDFYSESVCGIPDKHRKPEINPSSREFEVQDFNKQVFNLTEQLLNTF
jgi:hypothetical protein